MIKFAEDETAPISPNLAVLNETLRMGVDEKTVTVNSPCHSPSQIESDGAALLLDMDTSALDLGWLDQVSFDNMENFFQMEEIAANNLSSSPSQFSDNSSPDLSLIGASQEPQETSDAALFPSLQDVLRNQTELKLSFNLRLVKKPRLNEDTNGSAHGQGISLPQVNFSPKQTTVVPSAQPPVVQKKSVDCPALMERFPEYQVVDFKHVLYNLLVDNYNRPNSQSLVLPVRLEEKGVVRTGFRFAVDQQPEKKLAELYAKYVRKVDLQKENLNSVVAQDLYKLYFRSCVELLAKYFERRDRFIFLDLEVPLFVSGGSLEAADNRFKQIKVRGRKRKAEN